MSKLSRELCLPACLGIGVTLYAYSALLVPRSEGSIKPAETAAAPQPAKSEPQQLKPQPVAAQSVEPQPIKLAPLKPKPRPAASRNLPTATSTPDVTGAIGPQAATTSPHAVPVPQATTNPEAKPLTASEQLPQVPGIRVASLAPQAVPVQTPDATRWSPAVGYAPLVRSAKPVATNEQMLPPRAKKFRTVRRPYRRHTNFRVVIGVGPRW